MSKHNNPLHEIPSPRPYIFTSLKTQPNLLEKILGEVQFDPVYSPSSPRPPSHYYALRGESNVVILQGAFARHCPIKWGPHLSHLRDAIQHTLKIQGYNIATLNLFYAAPHYLRANKWTEQIESSHPSIFVVLGQDTRNIVLRATPKKEWSMTQGMFALAPSNMPYGVPSLKNHNQKGPWLLIVFRAVSSLVPTNSLNYK